MALQMVRHQAYYEGGYWNSTGALRAILVKDLWTIDNGVMTPTMKVKRNEVEKRYAKILAANDGTKAKVVWE